MIDETAVHQAMTAELERLYPGRVIWVARRTAGSHAAIWPGDHRPSGLVAVAITPEEIGVRHD